MPNAGGDESLLYFVNLKKPIEEGLKEKLELTPVITEFAAEYTVHDSNILSIYILAREAPAPHNTELILM